jgi:hypothetical protein
MFEKEIEVEIEELRCHPSDAFARGACHIFAYVQACELEEHGPVEIVTLVASGDPIPGCHTYARQAGLCFDSSGVHDEMELIGAWTARAQAEVFPELIRATELFTINELHEANRSRRCNRWSQLCDPRYVALGLEKAKEHIREMKRAGEML